MRTHAEWKVDTHIFWATGPTRAATRDFISSVALLVNVMARISKGENPCSLMSQAMRCVSTRVLPEPAPATISSGPPGWVTASRWTGFRSSSSPAGAPISRATLPAAYDTNAVPISGTAGHMDSGMFDPDSVTWRLHADPAMLIGG